MKVFAGIFSFKTVAVHSTTQYIRLNIDIMEVFGPDIRICDIANQKAWYHQATERYGSTPGV